ncbi:MAG: hypothetical protein ACK5FV_01110, partial [Bacteroidota bacterium]
PRARATRNGIRDAGTPRAPRARATRNGIRDAGTPRATCIAITALPASHPAILKPASTTLPYHGNPVIR